MLDIKHVASSSYHPQSQGLVERMHRTLNSVVRGLVAEFSGDWEERVPFCECILRISPMKALGGRTPYEVVTGLKPRLPSGLDMAQPVRRATVGDYAERLRQYFAETYASVRRVQAEAREELERRAGGHLSSELVVEDVVLLRSDPAARREGPLRLQARVRDELYRISRKIVRHTFHVEKLT